MAIPFGVSFFLTSLVTVIGCFEINQSYRINEVFQLFSDTNINSIADLRHSVAVDERNVSTITSDIKIMLWCD
jgi:hypothetical protein